MSETRPSNRYLPCGDIVPKFRAYHPILERVRQLIKSSERWTVNEAKTGRTVTIAFSMRLPEEPTDE